VARRMNQALTTRNYDGTFSHCRWQGGDAAQSSTAFQDWRGCGAPRFTRWVWPRVHSQWP